MSSYDKYEDRREAEAAEAAPAPEASGTLVVDRGVVEACPMLRRLRDGSATTSDDERWLVILNVLARCMTDGDLRERTILLRGAKAARELVGQMLVERGVAAERVTEDPRPESRASLVIALAETRAKE